jgi:hypothetical protein
MTAGGMLVRRRAVSRHLLKRTGDIAVALYIGWLGIGDDCRVVSYNLKAS